MKTLGLFVMALAVTLFYLIFFQVAPYVTNLLPNIIWTPLLTLLIYVFIGWFGGVGVPLAIFVIGIIIFIGGLQ